MHLSQLNIALLSREVEGPALRSLGNRRRATRSARVPIPAELFWKMRVVHAAHDLGAPDVWAVHLTMTAPNIHHPWNSDTLSSRTPMGGFFVCTATTVHRSGQQMTRCRGNPALQGAVS